MAPTPQQIIDKYHADREAIRGIRAEADAKVAAIEQFQANRENYLLTLEDPAIFDFLTDLYINGRDGKATAEAKKKDLGLQMKEIEKWLLKMLDKLRSTGFKTEYGVVFPTRKEGVSVEDFDALLDFAILRPIAEALLVEGAGKDVESTVESLTAFLKTLPHFEFLNKAVNKTAVLETMGDQDEKDHSRPNPPPPGVKYTAIRTVGVRAK
jgi:hypothetical protein